MLFVDAIVKFDAQERTAADYRCKCPAHDGKSKNSLSISPGDSGRALFYCSAGCGYQAIMAAAGVAVGNGAATRQWRDKQPTGGKLAARPRMAQPPGAEWQAAAMAAVEDCAARLMAQSSPLARGAWLYLTAGRGLTADTIAAARLGVNDKMRKVAGRWMGAGLTIPGIVSGSIWYLKIRPSKAAIEAAAAQGRDLAKYIALAGSHPALYGAGGLLAADVALICEGEFDALIAAQFCPPGWAAVTMGSASATADNVAWLRYFAPARAIFVATDNDQAGEVSRQKWMGLLPRAQALIVPTGKDITDYWQAGGDLSAWMGAVASPSAPEQAISLASPSAPERPGPEIAQPIALARPISLAQPPARASPPIRRNMSPVEAAVILNHIKRKEILGLPISPSLMAQGLAAQ